MAVIDVLIGGYRTFYQKYFASEDNRLYQQLSDGQSPKTLVIACCDSRVDPSIITTANPGDIFVVRNVANLVPPYETNDTGLHGVSAALEFAVCMLQVQHIVVLGHSKCAGISALLDGDDLQQTDFIGRWVGVASSAREKTLQALPGAERDMQQHRCEKESIQLSLENLMTFPWVVERVKAKGLSLHGWHFSLDDGALQEYNPKSKQFESIEVEG